MKSLFLILMFTFLWPLHCFSQEDEFSATTEEPAAEKEIENKDIFEGKTSIDKATKLRDPFKSPVIKKKSEVEAKREKSMMRNGVFTNVPTLESITLDNIKVVGTLMGSKPRALVTEKGSSKTTIMTKEGDKINNGKVELKAILPRGVVFVEQITNVYGQFEYLETVIPISD